MLPERAQPAANDITVKPEAKSYTLNCPDAAVHTRISVILNRATFFVAPVDGIPEAVKDQDFQINESHKAVYVPWGKDPKTAWQFAEIVGGWAVSPV